MDIEADDTGGEQQWRQTGGKASIGRDTLEASTADVDNAREGGRHAEENVEGGARGLSGR